MISFEKFTLDNQLRVIVHRDTSTPLACVNLLYDVGARDEDEHRTGFAHLFEHLMFGGSVNVPSYDEPLQLVGGENNAFTTNDLTNYYCSVPAPNLETAFWLESDRMLSLAFTDKSLEVQRNVVIEEFKQRYLNQPYGDVWLLLRPLAYKKHPYRWATIGKEIAHIEKATMDDVKAFFQKHYNPSNAILVVAGNVDPAEVKELSEKWFGSIAPGHRIMRSLSEEPLQTEARRLTVERDVPASSIYKAYHMCARTDPGYYAIDLVSDVLARGNSSRMYQSLVKEKRLFAEINAYVSGDMDKGLFVVQGKLAPGVEMKNAEEGILAELEKIKNEPVTERELLKCQNKVESTLTFAETDILTKATNLAVSELLGDAALVNTEVDKYRAVTVEEMQREARSVLREENCSTLCYLAK